MTEGLMGRDHSFLWNAEFWAKPQNLPISTECCRIWYWPVTREQISHIWSCSVGRKNLITTCRYDCAMNCATQALMAGILNLYEILLVYLVDRLHLSVAVASYKYCWGGRRKLTAIGGKLATVSRRIWQSGLQNLEIFAAENGGLHWWVRRAAELKLTTEAGIITMSIETDLSIASLTPRQNRSHSEGARHVQVYTEMTETTLRTCNNY